MRKSTMPSGHLVACLRAVICALIWVLSGLFFVVDRLGETVLGWSGVLPPSVPRDTFKHVLGPSSLSTAASGVHRNVESSGDVYISGPRLAIKHTFCGLLITARRWDSTCV